LVGWFVMVWYGRKVVEEKEKRVTLEERNVRGK
jgi:hypothetical protein